MRDEVTRLAQTANNESLINDELTDSRANHYYRECVQLFNQHRFGESYSSLLKAKEYRDDTTGEAFRRLLSVKLHKLKNNKEVQEEYLTKNNELNIEIEKLKEQIHQKEADIAENEVLQLKSKVEIDELYKDIDLKERAERNSTAQLQLAERKNKELAHENANLQKMMSDLSSKQLQEVAINEQNKEKVTSTTRENDELKNALSRWKHLTFYLAGLLIAILIITLLTVIIQLN